MIKYAPGDIMLRKVSDRRGNADVAAAVAMQIWLPPWQCRCGCRCGIADVAAAVAMQMWLHVSVSGCGCVCISMHVSMCVCE